MSNKKLFISLLILINITYLLANTKLPVIGILANPVPDNDENVTKSKVVASYVKWLESAGAETIIIHPWYNNAQLDDILGKVNGVLFQGGPRDLNLSHPFERTAKYILNKVIEFSNKDVILPLWGTCQGFELIHILLIDNWDLKPFDHYNVASPIEFNQSEKGTSKMFKDFSAEDLSMAEMSDVTAQFHNLGISLDQYEFYPDLQAFFKVTSYAIDSNEEMYVATVEGKKHPVYAVQFHPEIVIYERKPSDNIPNNSHAIRFSQHLANFFINEATKSKNIMSRDDMVKYDYINTFETAAVKQDNEVYSYMFEKKQ